MNALPRTHEDPLVDQCLAHVRALPFVRSATLNPNKSTAAKTTHEAVLKITTPSGSENVPCEVRRSHLRRDAAELLIRLDGRKSGLIVLAPAVGRDIGEMFERAGVNFVDAAGNCFLRLGKTYVARFQGRAAPEVHHADRALRAPAYRALFALLVRPSLLAEPVRAIATVAGVSPQTASDLRHRLIDWGLVTKVRGQCRWTPGRRKDALELWLGGFGTTIAPSLVIGRFRARETDPRELETRIAPILDSACEWRYSGGAAAMRLTQHYRGERTVIYLREPPNDLPARLRLVRDTAGPIQLARAPGELAFESSDKECVHPLLAYADLNLEGHDRAREAAHEIYERYLAETSLDA